MKNIDNEIFETVNEIERTFSTIWNKKINKNNFTDIDADIKKYEEQTQHMVELLKTKAKEAK